MKDHRALVTSALAGHALLGRLPPDLQTLLAERVRVRELVPGEAITREGSTATRWYLLLDGGARVSRTRPDGGQEVLARLLPGTLFGCLGVSDEQPRATTIAATGPARCVEFPKALLEGPPRSAEGRLALALRELLALAMNQQLRSANHRLYSLSRRMAGEVTEEPDKEPDGGWVLPD